MKYYDLIIADVTISADSENSSTLTTSSSIFALTENHVLLNDSLPLEISQDTTWTTATQNQYYGTLTLTFANSIHFSSALQFTCWFGIPDN